MQTGRCPRCGRPYVDDGIMTLCPGCQKELRPRPVAQPTAPPGIPPPPVSGQAGAPWAPRPVTALPPPPVVGPTPAVTPSPSQQALNLAYWALGLGIAGLLCCYPVAPVALWLGIKSNKEGGGGVAVAGIVMGGIGTVWLIASLILAVVYFGVIMAALGMGVAAAGTSGGTTP